MGYIYFCEIWRDARIAGQPEKHDPICIHLFSISDYIENVNLFLSHKKQTMNSNLSGNQPHSPFSKSKYLFKYNEKLLTYISSYDNMK